MIVLLTGFEPFGPDDANPSWEAARRLDGARVEPAEEAGSPPAVVRSLRVPVSWGRAADVVLDAVRSVRPDAIVMTGLSARRASVTPERVFINVRNGKDNEGVEERETPVVEGGPAAYFSTLPIHAIVDAIRAAGVPSEISNTAGTYLCNGLSYAVLHALADGGRAKNGPPGHSGADRRAIPAGFIHVPATPAIAARRQARAAEEGRPAPAIPSLAQETITEAMRAAVAAVARDRMRGQGRASQATLRLSTVE